MTTGTVEALFAVKSRGSTPASNDLGVPMLGIRQDVAADLAGADGKYTVPQFDATGNMRTVAAAGGATAANQATEITSLASIDGHVDGLEAGVGAPGDAAAGSDGASSGLIGLIRRLLGYLAGTYAGLLGTNLRQAGGTTLNGTATANGAIPVQAMIGATVVSATNPAPVTGAVQALVTSVDWRKTGTLDHSTLTGTLLAAQGVGLYNILTDLTFSSDTLGAAATLSVKDGSGTVLWQGRLQTTALPISKVLFGTPISGPENSLLQIAVTDPTSGTIYYAAGGSVVTVGS